MGDARSFKKKPKRRNIMNTMTKKELIIFKLVTFLLCTSITFLNYIPEASDGNRHFLYGY